MAEASVFISLTASVQQHLQAMALSGLFLAASVGMIGGLAVCSSVLQLTLRAELERRLAGFENKDTVGCQWVV